MPARASKTTPQDRPCTDPRSRPAATQRGARQHTRTPMATIQGGPGRGRYLVSCPDSAKLAHFVSESHADPELQLLDTIGPQGAPHTAVFDMAHATAAQLEQRFATSGDMKIEPDQPLSLFGPAH